MRKIILTEFISLDGVIEDPHLWTFDLWCDEIAKFKHDELWSTGALLLGRITYDGFADAWPNRSDEEGFADRINTLPKFVVSKTLIEPKWNNSSVISQDISQEILKLKQMDGQDIQVAGSSTLVKFLIQENLIDQYTLLVYPIILGKGKKLFNESDNVPLALKRSQTFTTGVVSLEYKVKAK